MVAVLTPSFIQGNISSHVIKMALTNMVSLSVFFSVDLINIYFISLLNNTDLVAAIGYASAILFFTTSLSIAMVIAVTAIVAKSIGQRETLQAKKIASTSFLLTLILSVVITFFVFFNIHELLTFMGARGPAREAANHYLSLTIFSFPMTALSMQVVAILRVLGRANVAMLCTLIAGMLNALLDPLFLFYFQWGIKGVAYATILAKMSMLMIACFYLLYRYTFIAKINFKEVYINTKKLAHVAIPASLTQITTPISHLYITYEIAKFGAAPIAAWTVISRLIPVVFVLLFAMPGAIGPIISQNLGAQKLKRIKSTLNYSLNFIIKYVFVFALALSLLQENLVNLFNATSETAMIIRFFCQYIAISFIFVAMNLVAMSFLNNIGQPRMATFINLMKILFGTVPFVAVGSYYFGVKGILIGQALGNLVFGLIAIVVCYVTLSKLKVD